MTLMLSIQMQGGHHHHHHHHRHHHHHHHHLFHLPCHHHHHHKYQFFSAVSYDEQNARVSVVYNDHSLYIWDVRDIRKVGILDFHPTPRTNVFIGLVCDSMYSILVFPRLGSLTHSCSTLLASGDSKSTRPPWGTARKQ